MHFYVLCFLSCIDKHKVKNVIKYFYFFLNLNLNKYLRLQLIKEALRNVSLTNSITFSLNATLNILPHFY